MTERTVALVCLTAIVVTVFGCLTVLVVRGLVPWSALAGAVVGFVLWVSKSPFASILEAALVAEVKKIVEPPAPAPAAIGPKPVPPPTPPAAA